MSKAVPPETYFASLVIEVFAPDHGYFVQGFSYNENDL